MNRNEKIDLNKDKKEKIELQLSIIQRRIHWRLSLKRIKKSLTY